MNYFIIIVLSLLFLGCAKDTPVVKLKVEKKTIENKAIELKRILNITGEKIFVENDTINISFESDILFEVSKYKIKEDFELVLEKITNFLKKYREFEVEIQGHTDSKGKEDFNQNLSENRAMSVKCILIKQGISSTRINSYGLGEEYPKYGNDTPEGRKQNRRAEIKLKENHNIEQGEIVISNYSGCNIQKREEIKKERIRKAKIKKERIRKAKIQSSKNQSSHNSIDD